MVTAKMLEVGSKGGKAVESESSPPAELDQCGQLIRSEPFAILQASQGGFGPLGTGVFIRDLASKRFTQRTFQLDQGWRKATAIIHALHSRTSLGHCGSV